MAITQVDTSTFAHQDSNATSVNITWPTGVAAGDYAILKGSLNSVSNPGSDPTGFGAALEVALSSASNTTTPQTRIYGMLCAGTESGSLSIPTPSTTSKWELQVWRGVDGTTPIDVTVLEMNKGATTVFDFDVDPTIAGVLVSWVAALNTNTGTWSSSTSGSVETMDDASPTPSTGMGHVLLSATTNQTINLRQTGSFRGSGCIIALRPATSSPGTMTTVVGTATAAGGSTAFTATATMSCVVGDAPAAGGSAAFTGAATFTTTAGAATAAGGSATFTAPATMTTVVGQATAAGGSATFGTTATMTCVAGTATADGGAATLTGGGTLSTLAGAATAAAGSATFTGAATFTTDAGTATAAGGTASFSGGAGSTMSCLTGTATAAGGTTIFTAPATLEALVGQATAAGQAALLTGAATFTTLAGAATAAGQTATFDGGGDVALINLAQSTAVVIATVVSITAAEAPPVDSTATTLGQTRSTTAVTPVT